MTDTPSVLFVVGSLREQSLNRQLAQAAAQVIGDRADVFWLEYADLPYVNQDIEFPPPAEVVRVREAVSAADAVWFFSPEYNHGIPGHVKTLIDWLSRPLTPDYSIPGVIREKTVTMSGAAGGSKASFVLGALEDLLGFLGCNVVNDTVTGVGLDREAYTTNILTVSDEVRASLEAQATALLEKI